jgi:hypothetical protein
MAEKGGCFCNKVDLYVYSTHIMIYILISSTQIRVNYTGEPNAHVLCHCLDCRKISGGSYSNNIVVPENNFVLESGTYPFHLQIIFLLMFLGSPKTISKVADTGKTITSHFCGDCGTTLFRTGDSFPGAVIIKAGILDDPE